MTRSFQPFPIPPRAPRASVLIVVLWVCLGLVSITLLFGHSMLMSFRGTDNDISGRQAEHAIEGAARYAEILLMNAEQPGLLPDVATYKSEAVPVGEATFYLLGRAAEDETGVTRAFGLIDEASKLNLNTATLAMLKALPRINEELAAAIIDWRDTDEEITENGAESETYLRRQPGYASKNAPFESVEELALLNGADRTILYGEDANLNGMLDPNENDGGKTPPADNSDGKLDPGVIEYVTVFSREPNKRSDGSARVNVSAPSEELATLLRETFGDQKAAEIQVRLRPGYRSVLEFFIASGMTADEFAQIGDAVTVSNSKSTPGLINVNTASETVLACVPGVDVEKASALVAARLTRAEQGTGIGWVVETLGEEGAIQAGRYLTGQSWQVSADVAAVGRHGRGYRRTRFVIDNSADAPRIIYRRNLAPLGWALGSDIREALASTKEAR